MKFTDEVQRTRTWLKPSPPVEEETQARRTYDRLNIDVSLGSVRPQRVSPGGTYGYDLTALPAQQNGLGTFVNISVTLHFAHK